jgi:hypothetical protein
MPNELGRAIEDQSSLASLAQGIVNTQCCKKLFMGHWGFCCYIFWKNGLF